ncbi:YhdP family protein [Alteromonas flava]|uniref:YhdP family protein n=1 Tax=Alteromonas flava TaxID=2048003 RepID=UPI000C28A515|nr:YhdP family protein [Alteromonas flava]
MSNVRQYLAYGIRKLWTLLAFVLVLSAVIISLLRFSLPYLDKNKHLVEDYISQTYKADLSIGSISAVWANHGPSLVLNDVILLDADTNALELSIGRIYVEVNFWQSLTELSIKSNQFELNQASLIFNTHLLTQIQTNEDNIVDVVSNLFLERLQRFSITDSWLTINTEANSQSYSLSSVNWTNSGDRHQAVGQMSVAELAKNSASFILDLSGDSRNLAGTLYARGIDLDLSPWFNEFTNEQQTLLQSRGNFALWVGIEDARVRDVQVELQPSQFEWRSQADAALITRIESGSIFAVPENQGWNFTVSDLILAANDKAMNTSFAGRFLPAGMLHVAALNDIQLAPLVELVPLFTNSDASEQWQAIAPTGLLTDFQLLQRPQGTSVLASATQLSWQANGVLPGLDNLNADFHWYKDQGRIRLNTANANLDSGELLDEAVAIAALNASVYVYQQPDLTSATESWYVTSNDISFASNRVEFTQQFSYRAADEHLLLSMQVAELPVTQVPALFPEYYMGSDTKNYLTRALKNQPVDSNATVNNATILWQGRAAHFPFDGTNGVFQAGVAISNAEFVFSEQWPALTELDIDLLFENDTLTMRAQKTRLQDIELTDLVATIPSLSAATQLQISAAASGSGKQLASLMQASQLADSLGSLFSSELLIRGDLATELALSIPLGDGTVRASGLVKLSDNQVRFPSVNLALEDVSGEVTFINDKVSIDDLSARLFAQPIAVALRGQEESAGYRANVSLQGQWSLDELIDRYASSLQPYAQGTSQVGAQLELITQADDFSYDLRIESQFSADAIRLPAPLADQPTESLIVTASGNSQASVIAAKTNNAVYFDGVLPHREKTFSRAHISVGDEVALSRGVGFSIAADVDRFDVLGWVGFVQSLKNNAGIGDATLLGVPERVFIDTQQLLVGETTIDAASVKVKQRDDDWTLDITGKQIEANVYIDDDWWQNGVQIDANYLRMESIRLADSQGPEWLPNQIPPFKLRCAACQIGRFDLGKVAIDGRQVDDRYVFENISFISQSGQLDATAEWSLDAQQQSQSVLNGVLTSSDFGELLSQTGFDSGINDSEAEFDVNLQWQGTPWNVDRATLGGEVNWELTDGYITEISDQGSRIFTLFSLNSLVRKLSLDFRDVFSQGFFYDDIKGTMQIANGRASTEDTVVDGGAGEITINGYSDLVENRLNYRVSFTPNVTGNLPILMYFMVNPPTALAALALDQMLTSAKVISNVNYSVTGTFDEPKVQEIGRDSTEVELPARNPSTPAKPNNDELSVPEPVSIQTGELDG